MSEGTMVILRTRDRRKLLWDAHLQARRFVEPLCRDDNASSSRKSTLYLSSNKCAGRKVIDSQQWGLVDRRVVVSHSDYGAISGKKTWGKREAEARQCQKIEMLFHFISCVPHASFSIARFVCATTPRFCAARPTKSKNQRHRHRGQPHCPRNMSLLPVFRWLRMSPSCGPCMSTSRTQRKSNSVLPITKPG